MIQVSKDKYKFGAGDALANKDFFAATGAVSEPYYRYNIATSRWEFSNDGVTANAFPIMPTFTPGSVLFAGATGELAQNNSKLFWDRIMERLGIGTPNPQSPLHVVGGILQNINSAEKSIMLNGHTNASSGENVFLANVSANLWPGSNYVFIANNPFVFGHHQASASIDICGASLISTYGIGLGTTAIANSIVIGWGNQMTATSGINTTTIVGSFNSVSTGLPGNPILTEGAVVFGGQNNTNAFVFGRGNTVLQNYTGTASKEKIVIGRGITDTQDTVIKNSFGFGIGSYACLFDLTNKNELFGGLLLTDAGYDLSATNTRYMPNGVAPTTTIANTFAHYAQDVVAGNAAPHWRTEAGQIIRLYRETTAVVGGAFVANTSGISDGSATYGGYDMGQVVAVLKLFGLLL